MSKFNIIEKKEFKIFTKDPEDFIKTMGEKTMDALAETIHEHAYLMVLEDKKMKKNLFTIQDPDGEVYLKQQKYK